jgi:hypothetical protein
MADVMVTFGAKIDELISAVDQVKGKLTEVASESKTTGEGMKASFEGALESVKGLLGIGGLTEIIRQVMELGTSTINMSALLGVSTERIGGLRVAAESAGTSLEQMAMVGERLMVNVQRTARDALSPAAQALQNLGLSAQQFQGLNFEQSLELIASKASQFDNSTGAVTRSLTVLIGRNQALIPLLLQGADAFRRNVDEGEAVAGMSREQAEALHEAEAEWVKLKNTLVALAGGDLSKDLRNAFVEINDLIHGQGAFLASLGENWQRLKDMVTNAAAADTAAITGMMAATKEIAFVDTSKMFDVTPIRNAAKEVAALSNAMSQYGENAKKVLPEINFGIGNPWLGQRGLQFQSISPGA